MLEKKPVKVLPAKENVSETKSQIVNHSLSICRKNALTG